MTVPTVARFSATLRSYVRYDCLKEGRCVIAGDLWPTWPTLDKIIGPPSDLRKRRGPRGPRSNLAQRSRRNAMTSTNTPRARSNSMGTHVRGPALTSTNTLAQPGPNPTTKINIALTCNGPLAHPYTLTGVARPGPHTHTTPANQTPKHDTVTT